MLGLTVGALLVGVVAPGASAAPLLRTSPVVKPTKSFGPLGPLTTLIIQRLLISDQVAAAKFGTGQPIDDPVREQQELAAVRAKAPAYGLAPDAAVAFFADQINASKIVQRGLFARWTEHPDQAPTQRPDLGQIRVELDALTTELLQQLQATVKVRYAPVWCPVDLSLARMSGEISNRLDALHRRALADATRSVCDGQPQR